MTWKPERKQNGSKDVNGFIELRSRKRQFEQLLQNIEQGETTLIVGARGSGKTTLAMVAAARLGRPLEIFHFGSLFDAEAAIMGSMMLRDGTTVFVPSRFVRAITTPNMVIVLDELNRAPGDALNALLGVLDFQRRLVLDLEEEGKRVVECAPGVTFVATANIGAEYVGVEPIDMALHDRMTGLRLGFPEDEERLLTREGVSRGQARTIARLAVAIREAHANGALPYPISTRRLVYVAKLVSIGVDMDEAFERNLPIYDDETLAALHATLKAAR